MLADLDDVIRSEEASGHLNDLQVLPPLYSHQATRRTEYQAEPGKRKTAGRRSHLTTRLHAGGHGPRDATGLSQT
jgi:hypothetical protein